MSQKQVTPGQRAILEFLQEDLRSSWRLAVRLLAKYSVVGEVEGAVGGVVLGGEVAGPGGVSVECVKEAATALSAIMSKGSVPKRDRALALEGLLSEVSGPCVRRLDGLRRLQQRQQQQEQAAEAAGPSSSPPPPPPAAAGEGTADAPVSAWPSPDSYSEVMRLFLALLNDGLPSLADSAAFRDRPPQERDDRLVSCLRVAVEGVGAVAECHRLKTCFVEGRAASTSSSSLQETRRPGVAPSGQAVGGGGSGGFPPLLREALVLVTGAVRSELAPLVHGGSKAARVS